MRPISPHMCGLQVMTFFQRGQCGKGRKKKVTLQWRNLTHTTSARWSRPMSTMISHVNSMYSWHDALRMALSLCGLPSPKPSTLLWPWNQHHTNPSWRTFHTTRSILLKTVKTKILSSNARTVRNCHSHEESKDPWQLNVMWYSEWDPETEQECKVKTRESWKSY